MFFRLGLACAALCCVLVPRVAFADDAPAVPHCGGADATLITPLNSRSTRAGDVFQFSTPADTNGVTGIGYGVVNFVRGAGRGGTPGELGVEARFVQLSNGTRVAAMIAPRDRSPSFVNGKTKNAPFFLGALGFAKGVGFHEAAGVIGVYNFLHSGSQATLPDGTPMHIILGDDYLTGGCALN
jgi:hypothetical protein